MRLPRSTLHRLPPQGVHLLKNTVGYRSELAAFSQAFCTIGQCELKLPAPRCCGGYCIREWRNWRLHHYRPARRSSTLPAYLFSVAITPLPRLSSTTRRPSAKVRYSAIAARRNILRCFLFSNKRCLPSCAAKSNRLRLPTVK